MVRDGDLAADGSLMGGANVTVSAGRDLTSVGTQFTADRNLKVEGKDTQAFYEAVNTQQSQTETRSDGFSVDG